MEAATTGTNRLHIGRFRSEYLVPAAHPDPQRLRRRLDETFEKRLPEVLQAMLGSWLSDSDESIWLIRRLDVPVVISTASNPDQSTRRFASEVSRALAQAVAGGGEDVIRFPNRAAYLAQFLSDLAAGRAWGIWYYESFRGLRALPVSAALRTAVCEEPNAGLSALLQLSDRAAEQFIASVTAQDARRILDDLPGTTGSENPAADFDRLWNAWLELGIELSEINQEPSGALRLYLDVCRRQPASTGGPSKAMARALVRMARCVGESPRDKRVLRALKASDPADLYAAAGGSDILHPLLHVMPERVEAAAHALQARRSGSGPMAHPRSTQFGGLFLLMPMLDALPLDEATGDWPDLNKTRAADAIRFLILLKCFGRGRASRMFSDPLVRDLMTVAPAVTWSDVRNWLGGRSRAQLDTLLASCAAWQKDQDAVAGKDLALVGVPLPGAGAGVLVDLRRGVWLLAESYTSNRVPHLAERVQSWLARVGFAPIHIAADSAFGDSMRSAFREATVDTAEQFVGRKVAADVAELVQPAALRSARPADLAVSVVAQQVLRAFAWRLPGFASSSHRYLFANLLDIPADLDDEAERRLVRLGQPPLQYVLGITGMARSTYRVGWLDERPFVLYQEGL